MITDKIGNIGRYIALYPNIAKVAPQLNLPSLNAILEKVIINDVALIPISSKRISDSFDKTVYEAHKTTMDIHIVLSGTDVIAYADLDAESRIFKEYDEQNDYLLAHSDVGKIIQVPAGYFCIIPNNFAHMALYEGHADVKKVVVKLPVMP